MNHFIERLARGLKRAVKGQPPPEPPDGPRNRHERRKRARAARERRPYPSKAARRLLRAKARKAPRGK